MLSKLGNLLKRFFLSWKINFVKSYFEEHKNKEE
jgi:hypothetical protein